MLTSTNLIGVGQSAGAGAFNPGESGAGYRRPTFLSFPPNGVVRFLVAQALSHRNAGEVGMDFPGIVMSWMTLPSHF